ncbi:MAG: hypothetical protein E7G42_25025, partial [Serratia marcescens]|nr:hypothetical protein [Serratia marcescens]
MNTLDKIQSHLELLSKSERKVAEVILASPQTAIHSSIAAGHGGLRRGENAQAQRRHLRAGFEPLWLDRR